ncbi:MAG TPA: TonB family protein, partial [Candidatus Acidoferrum sp.]|nr:TonB family protein [Candidatus Acidoferrum sp.]
AGTKPQPVAMEIPVTVNGASTVAGGDKRQPFSETTQTVLVFGSGAVIRLAAAVGPGQLLFVTNEKSKQEVVCQVVKTKQNGNGAGYVELKFTEATTDFWGIRAGGNGAAPAAPAGNGTASVGAPAKTPAPKPAIASALPPTVLEPPTAALPPATIAVEAPAALPPAPVANANPAAPVVPAEPPAQPKIPSLSEFLTHGSNGPELKSREKTQTGRIATAEAAKTATLTETTQVAVTNMPQRVSSEPEAKRSLSAALGVNQSPAPGSASFDLSATMPAEEVKIPAWLEPLARNSALAEGKPAEGVLAEVPGFELRAEEKIPALAPAETVTEPEAAPVLAAEGRAPNFGTSLALDSQKGGAVGSGRGLKIVLAIAALLLAAAAAWYWFVNQAPKVSADGIGTVAESNPASIPAPSAGVEASEPSAGGARNSSSVAADPASAAVLQPAAATTSDSVRPYGSAARGNGGKSVASANGPASAPAEEVAEESARKPALGRVRLAAPNLTRNAAEADNAAADPGLALNTATPADSSSLGLLASKGKGPAAPLPVGGDVKVARLLSSVPPVYPQMARSQRVAGDVTIDALVDGNGRVSAMRVVSGPALLHDAALSAVKQWKYQPATLNGVPTSTHLNVTVQFRLQ